MSAEHVAALEGARRRIWSGGQKEICIALGYPDFMTNAKSELICWIKKALGNVSLKTWLRKRGIVLSAKQMREYRLAWIDQMIPIVREWK